MCCLPFTGTCRDGREHVQPPQYVHAACACVHTCPMCIDLSMWTLHTFRNRPGEHGVTHSTNELATAPSLHLARMSCDRIGLLVCSCQQTAGTWPGLGLVASDLQAIDRTRLQVYKVQALPHRLTDAWPLLPPTGVRILSDSGDFPASPALLSLPSPAAQPIWAPMGASGCGQSGREYPTTFSGQSLSSVFPPHPT